MANFPVIAFDFGGVIMKTVDYGPRRRWDERLGLPAGSVERAVHNQTTWVDVQRGALSMAHYWESVAGFLGVTMAEVDQIARDFYEGDRLEQNTLSVIDWLRDRGVVVALLSNDSVDLRVKLQRLDLEKLFEPLLISAEIGAIKPDAQAYEALIEATGRAPADIIFIDDRLENIEGAQKHGIRGIHYGHSTVLPEILAPLLDA